MVPDSTGKLRIRVRSEVMSPEPMTPGGQAYLARAVARTARMERPLGMVSDLGSLLSSGP